MTSRALAQAVIQAPRPDEFHACSARSSPRICSLFSRSFRSDATRKARRSFCAAANIVAVDGAVKASEILNGEKLPDAPAAEAKSILSDVTNLIKLVDSKDIVELELKHKDFEVVIRKAEALLPAPAPAPAAAPLSFPGYPAFPGFASPVAPAPAPAPVADSAPATPAAPALPAAPQYPPLLSPMAGNFYRSPGPGEPPFVKVGDKVRKGQVLCIIEAMKLMNEIESDQDGTLVEVVAEDGKPIAAEAPLFVIKP